MNPEVVKRIPSWVDNDRDLELAVFYAWEDIELEAMKHHAQANECCADDEQQRTPAVT